MFASWPKVGDLWHATERFGVAADAVDLLDGRWQHEVESPMVFEGLLRRVCDGRYAVVWLAPPCSSISVLHSRKGRKRLRSREEPEGLDGLCEAARACVQTHNELAASAAQLAREGFDVRATYVIENPVDRGKRGSEHFRIRCREHAPIWLLLELRQQTCRHLCRSFPSDTPATPAASCRRD